jgi:3-oxoacyl-[acyl-carrier-protein] synthase II
MSRTRVVVTGLGATTPLGGDAVSTWDGLLAGRSCVRAIENEWAADLPVRIAAQVAVDPGEVLERVEARRLDRSAQLAVIAAMEAWQSAGFGLKEDNPVDRDRLGVAIATGIGGLNTLLGNWDIQKE